jgi:CelD/BcsL family acetyltransferase involved in cellulose biosynthesis
VERDRVGLESCAGPLVQEWVDLVSREGAVPFLHPGWVQPMASAFFPATPLRLVTVRRADRLVGVLPMLLGRRRLFSPTTFGSTPLFCPLAADEAARAGLVDGLLATSPGRLDLAFLPEADPTVPRLWSAAGQRGALLVRRTLQNSPYVEATGNWEAYLRRWSTGRAKVLRKKQRWLERGGPVSFELSDGRVELDRLLGEGLALESAGWKGAAGTAVLSSPPATRFYREATAWAAEQGILRLGFLRVSGRAVAFSLLIEHGDSLYQLKAGYDPAEAACSPSTLLTLRLLEHAFRTPHLRSFEFLGKDEPYKLEFADHTRELLGVRVYTNGLTAGLELAADHATWSAKNWARERAPASAWQRLSGLRAGVAWGLRGRRRATAAAAGHPMQASSP